MHVIVASMGSLGDTLPFIALGKALADRGHDVLLAGNGYFRDAFQETGCEFVELGTAEEYLVYVQQQADWSPAELLRRMAADMIEQSRRLYDLISERYQPGQTIVVAQGYGVGARLAQEKLGVPLATIHLQPLWMRSTYHPPALPRWTPRLVPQLIDYIVDYVIDRGLKQKLDPLRASLGLAPVKRIMKHWWNSPQLVLGLFPDWFETPRLDWPPNVVLTGFPLYQGALYGYDRETLERFLAAGEPPLVFSNTCVAKVAEPFFRVSIAVAQQLRRRAVLLAPYGSHVPQILPNGICHFPFVPLEAILPRAAAHVHHGGIGTIAQTLAAGIPQITVPMVMDQSDNSLRLRRLNASAYLKPARYTVKRVSAEIERLLGTPAIGARCRELSERMRSTDSLRIACEALEQLHFQNTATVPAGGGGTCGGAVAAVKRGGIQASRLTI